MIANSLIVFRSNQIYYILILLFRIIRTTSNTWFYLINGMIHIKTAISGMFSSVCSVCSAYMHQTGLLGSLLFINLNPLSQFQTFCLMKHKMLITNDATQNWETVTERKWSSSIWWFQGRKIGLKLDVKVNIDFHRSCRRPPPIIISLNGWRNHSFGPIIIIIIHVIITIMAVIIINIFIIRILMLSPPSSSEVWMGGGIIALDQSLLTSTVSSSQSSLSSA